MSGRLRGAAFLGRPEGARRESLDGSANPYAAAGDPRGDRDAASCGQHRSGVSWRRAPACEMPGCSKRRSMQHVDEPRTTRLLFPKSFQQRGFQRTVRVGCKAWLLQLAAVRTTSTGGATCLDQAPGAPGASPLRRSSR